MNLDKIDYMVLTKEDKIKNDKALAYFSGWRIDDSFPDKGRIWRRGNALEVETTFKFSEDWNVLTDIVERIEKLGYNFHTHQARVRIELNDVGLMRGADECDIEIRSSMVDFDKKMATYLAASKFALSFNEKQLTKA